MLQFNDFSSLCGPSQHEMRSLRYGNLPKIGSHEDRIMRLSGERQDERPLSLSAIQRSRGFLLLASGYLFSSIMVVPWVLTFPGVAELPA